MAARSSAVEANRGDDQDTYSRDELTAKYFSLTARMLPHEVADDVGKKILMLDRIADIRSVFAR